MIAGDWRWYLDTYRKAPDGSRDWSGQFGSAVQVYDAGAELAESVVISIAYTPVHSMEYEGRPMPAPEGVRWGSVTCVRKDFADLLAQNLDGGVEKAAMRLRNGAMIREWVPIFVKNRIRLPSGQKDDAKTVVQYLTGEDIFCSNRYSLILPEKFFRLVAGFGFKRARVTSAES